MAAPHAFNGVGLLGLFMKASGSPRALSHSARLLTTLRCSMTSQGENPKFAVGDRVRVITAPSTVWIIQEHRLSEHSHVYDLKGPRWVWFGVKEAQLELEGAKDTTEVVG